MAHLPESIENMKHATGIPGVLEVILHRWSPRAYAERDVAPEDLKRVFEAARWAASSYNEQPWRFLVGHKGSETYTRIFDTLVPQNQSWAKSAPVLILSVAKKHFTHSGDQNLHAWHDVGAATATLGLQATALGLHAHSMAGFDHALAKSSFGIPDDHDTVAVTALGYLGDSATLPDTLRKMEESPRQRKELKDIVFSGWQTPSEF